MLTDEERGLAIDACLEDLGYAVLRLPHGSADILGMESFDDLEDFVACQIAVEGPRIPLSEGDLQLVYEMRLESRDCPEAQGYEIPDPPSLDVFIESYEAMEARDPIIISDKDIIGPWYPHSFLNPRMGVAVAEYERILEVCPVPELG